MKASSQAEFISANLIDKKTGRLAFRSNVKIERGGLKVGVIGLLTQIPRSVESLELLNYLDAGKKEIEIVKDSVDIIVILLNSTRNELQKAREQFTGANYIFASRETARTRPEKPQKKESPLVYAMSIQGKYIGRIDIKIEDKEKPIQDITGAKMALITLGKRLNNLQKRDPNKSLEEIYESNPNVLKMVDSYQKNLRESESKLNDAVNTSFYSLIPLNRDIGDEETLLAYVDKTLKTCLSLEQKQL